MVNFVLDLSLVGHASLCGVRDTLTSRMGSMHGATLGKMLLQEYAPMVWISNTVYRKESIAEC